MRIGRRLVPTLQIISALVRWALPFLLLNFIAHSVAAEELAGTWVGQQMKIVIEKQGGVYVGAWEGPPSFSGPLYNLNYRQGKQPGTMVLTMTSRVVRTADQNEVVLRFYLMHDMKLGRLHGFGKFDFESGEDKHFEMVVERQPCCHSQCLHPSKSRCQ